MPGIFRRSIGFFDLSLKAGLSKVIGSAELRKAVIDLVIRKAGVEFCRNGQRLCRQGEPSKLGQPVEAVGDLPAAAELLHGGNAAVLLHGPAQPRLADARLLLGGVYGAQKRLRECILFLRFSAPPSSLKSYRIIDLKNCKVPAKKDILFPQSSV